MAKPRKKRTAKKEPKPGLPKNTAEWEALTDDQVMAHIFGPEVQQELKNEALTNDTPKPEKPSPA